MIGGTCGCLALRMISNLAVSDDTMKRARSFIDTRGISRLRREEPATDEILASAHATLARQTIIDSGAEHLGFYGYFLFEAIDRDRGTPRGATPPTPPVGAGDMVDRCSGT